MTRQDRFNKVLAQLSDRIRETHKCIAMFRKNPARFEASERGIIQQFESEATKYAGLRRWLRARYPGLATRQPANEKGGGA